MPFTGKGRREILVIAETPGKLEDERNTQLIGRAGQRLRRSLEKIDVGLDRDCWKTNSVICFPGGTPTDKQVQYCFPTVKKTILELQPKTIILLGAVSVSSVLGWLWKPKPGAISKWAGWQIPSQELNAWICPTFHSSYLLRQEKTPNVALEFDKHLKSAFELEGRPWEKVPQWHNDIEVLLDTSKAARIVRKMISKGGKANRCEELVF
jgi:uracil-DNA glycosylase family 4